MQATRPDTGQFETRFWQPMVDHDTGTAPDLLGDTAPMVSIQGQGMGRPTASITTGLAILALLALAGCTTPPYAVESGRTGTPAAAVPSARFDLDAATPNGMVGLPPTSTIGPN